MDSRDYKRVNHFFDWCERNRQTTKPTKLTKSIKWMEKYVEDTVKTLKEKSPTKLDLLRDEVIKKNKILPYENTTTIDAYGIIHLRN